MVKYRSPNIIRLAKCCEQQKQFVIFNTADIMIHVLDVELWAIQRKGAGGKFLR